MSAFQGTKNVSGRKRVWAQTYMFLPRHDCDHTIITCQGTNVSGHKHVWAQLCLGTNVPLHNRVWAQTCLGTIVCGHNRVWAQSCLGTIASGHNRVWAQSCGHNRVHTIVWAQVCMGTIVWSPLQEKMQLRLYGRSLFYTYSIYPQHARLCNDLQFCKTFSHRDTTFFSNYFLKLNYFLSGTNSFSL